MIPHAFLLGRRDKQEKMYRLGKLGGFDKVYVLSKDYCLRDISGCKVTLYELSRMSRRIRAR